MGLDGVLRSRGPDVSAILNGVDEEEFDPARDPRIETPYDGAALGRKADNKVAVQRWSGLAEAATVPLLGVVARLVDQKGIDILLGAVDELAALGVQLVVAGVGEPSYRLGLEEAVRRHRGRVGYHGTDGEDAARRIYAGADLFLAPSSYEPCGLAPLIALRYGTIPVVRHTGGLAETIADVDRAPGSGLGFSFSDRDPGALVAAVRRAVATYRQTGRWQGLQRRAMAARFSWNEAAVGYEQLYRDVMSRPRAIPRRVPAASAPAAG
jgi:ADP-glucose type glycogen/starch synthase